MSHQTTIALRLDHVTKHYGSARGIEDVSLEVFAGEVFGFLGPNGAGKSTTINTILDLLRADSGHISVFGLDSRHDSLTVKKRIGYLAGDMETDTSLTGAQYLKYAANLHGQVNPENIQRLIKRLRCDTNRKIRHLSRGNRQKIGLVAALMHDPDLLILDEPTAGLDPLIQAEFNAIVKEHQARGKTTFMSSHVLSEVQSVCDRVGFIKDGKLFNVSKLDELTSRVPRRVSVTFTTNVPDSRLEALKGVSNYRKSEQRRNFDFKGDYSALLKVLSSVPVTDMVISEPELEELFMNFYRGADHV